MGERFHIAPDPKCRTAIFPRRVRIANRTSPIYALTFAERPHVIIVTMPKKRIGVDVLVEDHFWNEAHGRYVYSFYCPGCRQLKIIPELGIHRCDCGSWLIVRDQP
jgi:hypothetical protein